MKKKLIEAMLSLGKHINNTFWLKIAIIILIIGNLTEYLSALVLNSSKNEIKELLHAPIRSWQTIKQKIEKKKILKRTFFLLIALGYSILSLYYHLIFELFAERTIFNYVLFSFMLFIVIDKAIPGNLIKFI